MMKNTVVLLLFLSFVVFVYAQPPTDSNDDAPAEKLSILPRPPLPPRPSPSVYLPGIMISANSFSLNMRYCYCFSFKCEVPGMYNGFKGWVINNKKGYFAFNGKLYIIYRCDQPRNRKYPFKG